MHRSLIGPLLMVLLVSGLGGCSAGQPDATTNPGSGGGSGGAAGKGGSDDAGSKDSGALDGAAGAGSGGEIGTGGMIHDAGSAEAPNADSSLVDGSASDAGSTKDASPELPPSNPPGTHPDIVSISPLANTKTNPGGEGWMDSYSHDRKCWCDSTLDHDIGKTIVDTPFGKRTVAQVCAAQMASGKRPSRASGDPIYNTVQCGNPPYNTAGDEDPKVCPGRVDIGGVGCGQIGPTWDFSLLAGHL